MVSVRHRSRHQLPTWCLLGVCAVTVGCGDVSRIPVQGRVVLDGKPVDAAAVTFIPAAAGRPGLAVTDAEGRFVLRDGGMVGGVPPGRYDVVIMKVKLGPARSAKMPALGPHKDGEQPPLMDVFFGDQPIEKYIVPQKYSDRATSGISVTVEGGMRPVAIELSSKS
jgi:hypothetical protein